MFRGGRESWSLEIRASVLAEAAGVKANFHLSRKAFWEGELEAAEKALKEEGIDFRSNAISGGYRTDVVIDPERQRRVNECRERMETHKRLFEEYDGYVRFLTFAGEREMSLRPDDITFFDLQLPGREAR